MVKPQSGPAEGDYWHFKERPSQVFIDRVCDHIARTGQPETQPELFRGRLSKDEFFFRLKRVVIDIRLRPEGDLAPCPRCHSANKFKDGWLVYLHERGAAAVVGNDCASGEAQDAADREWGVRQQRTRDEDYLMEVMPRLQKWMQQIDHLSKVAEPASEFARCLRIDGKEYFERLRLGRAQGGRLTVTQVLARGREGPRGIRTAGSIYETADHDVGVLAGLPMINPTFAPAKALREVSDALRPLIHSNDDAAFYFVANMQDDIRRKVAAELQGYAHRVLLVSRELLECRAFLSAENVQLLDEWGQHPYTDFRFSASLSAPEQSGHRRFELRGKPYFQHRVPPTFWAEIAELRLV